jgi:hypothetical protein
VTHALVLLHAAEEHPRTPWLARCSCGSWTGRPCRRRREAAKHYGRHRSVVERLSRKRTAGYKPRRPTPAGALPLDLQPLVVSFS